MAIKSYLELELLISDGVFMNGTIRYTIRPYDTIWMLAQIFNTTVDSIMELNPGIEPRNLMIGQVITIRPGYQYYPPNSVPMPNGGTEHEMMDHGMMNGGMNQGSMGQGGMGQGSMNQGTSQGSMGQRGTPQGSMNSGSIPQGNMSPGSMPQGSMGQGGMNQGTSPGSMGQGGMNQGTSPGSMGQRGTPQGSMSPGSMNQGSSQGSMGQRGTPQSSMNPGSTPQGSMGQGGMKQGTTQGGMNHDFMEGMVGDVMDLRDYFRLLWDQHVEWTRMAVMGQLHDLPETDLIVQRLLRNPEDFADVLAPFYGDRAAAEFQKLLTAHLTIASEIVKAVKANDTKAVAEADQRWHDNADQIAAFLAALNPYWKEEDWNAMLEEHLNLLSENVDQMAEGDYADSIEGYDEMELQALEMADMMSEGIAMQFPG